MGPYAWFVAVSVTTMGLMVAAAVAEGVREWRRG